MASQADIERALGRLRMYPASQVATVCQDAIRAAAAVEAPAELSVSPELVETWEGCRASMLDEVARVLRTLQ